MANAINSPTAQNLSHKSIIELANITYENARAAVEAKEQADADVEAARDHARDAEIDANAAAGFRNAAADSANAAAQSAAEVAAALSGKVDKTENAFSVYGTLNAGVQTIIPYSSSAVGETIVRRNQEGRFAISPAISDTQAATFGQAKRFYHSIDSKNDITPDGDTDGHLTFICTAKSTGYYSTFAALAQNLIGTVFTGSYTPGGLSGTLPTTECIIYAFSATHWRVVFLDNAYTSPYDFNPSTVSSVDFFDAVIVY